MQTGQHMGMAQPNLGPQPLHCCYGWLLLSMALQDWLEHMRLEGHAAEHGKLR